MAYSDESDLKYIESLDDIPSSGQGIGRSWDPQEKLDAAEAGESKLEADINEGFPIADAELETLHREAAAEWATYKLVLGMKSPDSATRGDSLDEGTERLDFAKQIRADYYDYIESIRKAEDDRLKDEGEDIGFFVADWI